MTNNNRAGLSNLFSQVSELNFTKLRALSITFFEIATQCERKPVQDSMRIHKPLRFKYRELQTQKQDKGQSKFIENDRPSISFEEEFESCLSTLTTFIIDPARAGIPLKLSKLLRKVFMQNLDLQNLNIDDFPDYKNKNKIIIPSDFKWESLFPKTNDKEMFKRRIFSCWESYAKWEKPEETLWLFLNWKMQSTGNAWSLKYLHLYFEEFFRYQFLHEAEHIDLSETCLSLGQDLQEPFPYCIEKLRQSQLLKRRRLQTVIFCSYNDDTALYISNKRFFPILTKIKATEDGTLVEELLMKMLKLNYTAIEESFTRDQSLLRMILNTLQFSPAQKAEYTLNQILGMQLCELLFYIEPARWPGALVHNALFLDLLEHFEESKITNIPITLTNLPMSLPGVIKDVVLDLRSLIETSDQQEEWIYDFRRGTTFQNPTIRKLLTKIEDEEKMSLLRKIYFQGAELRLFILWKFYLMESTASRNLRDSERFIVDFWPALFNLFKNTEAEKDDEADSVRSMRLNIESISDEVDEEMGTGGKRFRHVQNRRLYDCLKERRNEFNGGMDRLLQYVDKKTEDDLLCQYILWWFYPWLLEEVIIYDNYMKTTDIQRILKSRVERLNVWKNGSSVLHFEFNSKTSQKEPKKMDKKSFVPHGPLPDREMVKNIRLFPFPFTCGLPNPARRVWESEEEELSNICYMNASLQCIFNTTDLFESVRWKERTPIIQTCNNFYNAVWREVTSNNAVVNYLKDLMRILNMPPGQQDAHEFLMLLTSALDDAFQNRNPATLALPSYQYGTDLAALVKLIYEFSLKKQQKRSWATQLPKRSEDKTNEKNPIERLFNSYLIQMITYNGLTRGNSCPSTYSIEPNTLLSIPIPAIENQDYLVRNYINNYMAGETILATENPLTCSTCGKVHESITKSYTFYRLPQILILQLKRFDASGKNKNTRMVEIPEYYEINEESGGILSSSKKRKRYQVSAIIHHQGGMSLNTGHYYAMIYKQEKNIWMLYNDKNIEEVDKEKALKNEYAYIIFYRQVA